MIAKYSFSQIEKNDGSANNRTMQKPHELKAYMDKYIIGQEDAKKTLAVAIYNHYKRVNGSVSASVQKSNILLAGPTGSGKTYLLQVIAKMLDVPIVIADATSLTAAGYVGEDVESILEKLIRKANGDIALAEKGIVYIDEIDKIAKKDGSSNTAAKDISGEGVQQGLLKLLEGSEVAVSVGKTHFDKEKVTIDTSGILFVCGGAFVGMDDIIKKRIEPSKRRLGFSVSEPNESPAEPLSLEMTHDDVVSYGFIPEFIGRISVLATLDALSVSDLEDILTKPEDSIVNQYRSIFESDGIKLSFEHDAIKYIAEQAVSKNTGARGLKGALDKKMYKVTYDTLLEGKKEVNITKELLLKGGQ